MNKFKKFFKDIFAPEVEYILPLGQPQVYVPPTHTLPVNGFRVERKHGQDGASWIEPALSSFTHDVTDWDRLIWLSAVLYEETGIRVIIREGESYTNDVRNIEPVYTMSGEDWGMTGRPFIEVWTYIQGMAFGYEQARGGHVRPFEGSKGKYL